jgi:hypothetical protein
VLKETPMEFLQMLKKIASQIVFNFSRNAFKACSPKEASRPLKCYRCD